MALQASKRPDIEPLGSKVQAYDNLESVGIDILKAKNLLSCRKMQLSSLDPQCLSKYL